MSLIKTISGIRGTIGGRSGENLTPIDIVECTAGYGKWLLAGGCTPKVVIGRDGRVSGEMVKNLAVNTLIAMGIDVIDLDLSTTPTVEMAVVRHSAGGGIILTASHNPYEWNALKLLNHRGEFISAKDGDDILNIIEKKDFEFANADKLGRLIKSTDDMDYHVRKILELPHVNTQKIKNAGFKVVVDCINSTGALAIPSLLDALGVDYSLINAEITGIFAHNPEPLPEHLSQVVNAVKQANADLGIVVDPDVDRLAFVCENGDFFGEEYTLVAVADYILTKSEVKNTVSNLSSTRALADITKVHGGYHSSSKVGEVNVVEKMKETGAVIGGEGNGGVIFSDLHYGRDALVGIALFLSLMSEHSEKASVLKKRYPHYLMVKDKMPLMNLDINSVIFILKEKFKEETLNFEDGIKIDFAEGWVHVRGSNTEPIVRIYSESTTELKARELVNLVKSQFQNG